MKRAWLRGLWIALGSTALACYMTYTGIYVLDDSGAVATARAQAVADSLASDLAELGFVTKPSITGANMVAFGKKGSSRPAQDYVLPGADATVTVAVSLERPSITVRDLSNDKETPFIRELEQRIERRLAEQGIAGRFVRQGDFFYY